MGFPPQGTVVVTPITAQQIWEYAARVLTNLPTSRARSGEFEVGFPITPASQNITGPADTAMTERTLTPTIPADASLVSVKLIAMITAMENSGALPGVANEIDLIVQVRKGAGAWNSVFDQDEVIGLINNQSTTTGWAGAMDVGNVVNEAGVQYGFRFVVGRSTTQIRFTQGFVLVVKYRMD